MATQKRRKKQIKIGGNLHPTPPDNRDFGLADIFLQPDISEVPAEWSFWKPLEIKNQQDTQECTGHGVAAAIEAHEGVILNPSAQYAFIKEIVGSPTDDGADLRSAMKSGLAYGAVEKKDCDIGVDNRNGAFLADLANYPPEVIEQAKPHKQASYFNATRGRYNRFDNFRSWLWYFRNEKPVIVTGVGWRENWTYAEGGVIPEDQGDIAGGHCVVILPEQRIINGEPYLKIQNSYSIDVGDKGCFWVNRKVVNRDFTFGGYIFKDLDPEVVKQIINQNNMAEEPSVRYQFNTEEGNKVFKSLLISLAGFVLIKLVELLGQFDFGNYATLVAALSPFVVNSIKLFVQGQGAEVLGKKK
jgi:hypothetical protein